MAEGNGKKTYPQDWPAYNVAQTTEKAQFQVLLHDLCKGIPEPEQKIGRKRLPLRDMVFSAIFKVYSTLSGRRFMTDLREANGGCYISKVPHFNSVLGYLEKPKLTVILHELIVQSSLPLKAIETDFAVDSSGFSTSKLVHWRLDKYRHRELMRHDWVRVHLMVGVKTHIVTAVEIGGRHTHDTVLFPHLLDGTAQNFQIAAVMADKGYSSIKNLRLVAAKGAMPYILFNKNATDRGEGDIWDEMYHYYCYKRKEFMEHYHLRSNVESVFSMIKGKFGDYVRAKTPIAQVNEVLCKVLAHNICVLIQSVHELGIKVAL